MSRKDVTLTGDTAERFEEQRERLSEDRIGDKISRPEFVRILMDSADVIDGE